MRRFLLALTTFALGLTGLGLLFGLVTLDFPVYLGSFHADYPDPNRPGYLKGLVVTTPEIVLKTGAAFLLLSRGVAMAEP